MKAKCLIAILMAISLHSFGQTTKRYYYDAAGNRGNRS